ncbi:MAG: right-handed parallel beta-helix repeat-containing protein, partial [Verrucomicrobiota bacterium]
GTTQPGFVDEPVIEITGRETFNIGMTTGSDSTFRGLAIYDFTQEAIRSFGDDTRFEGCYFGASPSGSATGNVLYGIATLGGSDRLTISNCVFGRTVLDGVLCGESDDDMVIEHCWFGLDPDGNVDLEIGDNAVRVLGRDAIIRSNVIVNTDDHGVRIGPEADRVQVLLNDIGVVPDEGIAPGIDKNGVLIEGNGHDVRHNRIGAVDDEDGIRVEGDGNTLHGNVIGRIGLFGNLYSPPVSGQGIHLLPGSDLNVISSNTVSGCLLAGIFIPFTVGMEVSVGNQIHDNVIGLDTSGGLVLTNFHGVDVAGPDTLIEDNVVSGNQANGINLRPTASNSTVQLNRVGTGLSGTSCMSNGFDGVSIEAPGVMVTNNVIGCNGRHGLLTLSAARVEVGGNFVGTSAAQNHDLGNGVHGLFLFNTVSNRVEGNVIGGNRSNALFMSFGVGAEVSGNFVGSRSDEDTLLTNAFRHFNGIAIHDMTGNLIGGNVAGNTRNAGMELVRGGGHTVINNRLGVFFDGRTVMSNVVGLALVDTGLNHIGSLNTGLPTPTNLWNVLSGNLNVGMLALFCGPRR